MAIKFTNTPQRPPVEQKTGKVKATKKGRTSAEKTIDMELDTTEPKAK